MRSELSTNPWAEFRKRRGACEKTLALGVFSCLMLFSEELYTAWTIVALFLLVAFLFFAFRVALLRCPRCDLFFYWPPRLTQRIGRCVHCKVWRYDPYNIDGLSERQHV
jgi:hypothetical protein